jgi:hypothetical protein
MCTSGPRRPAGKAVLFHDSILSGNKDDGVEALGAEVDLRAGGAWRIGNKMADGSVLWIGGIFNASPRPICC